MATTAPSVGMLLKDWRQRRRLSQLELACEAGISARHLSFVETSRSTPSREMLLHIADHLNVPLRERNALLLAAGYAPAYPVRPLNDPALTYARKAVDLLLTAHEPFPALAVDRHWTLIASNETIRRLLAEVAPSLLTPPVNVLRLTLHPDGLARRIDNLPDWRAHVLERLRHQTETTGDPVLAQLLTELSSYPVAAPTGGDTPSRYGNIMVPLSLRTDNGVLNFISTTTVFGTPLDVTLADLAIEAFFPADAATAQMLGSAGERTY